MEVGTERGSIARAGQPTRSTRPCARRKRNNPHRTWGHLGASPRQPRGGATSWPPRARPNTTAVAWALRARQRATPRAPGTGAPMLAPTRTWFPRRRGPNGRSKTRRRRYAGVMHAVAATKTTSSWRRTLRRRHPSRWRGRNEPSSYLPRWLRRELPWPPRLRCAHWVLPPRSHGPGTTPL